MVMPDFQIYEWAYLRQMPLLRVLHVSRIHTPETIGLAQVVRSLSNLEEPLVRVSPEMQDSKALTFFLRSCFLKTKIEAESSLKSLSLVDCYRQ